MVVVATEPSSCSCWLPTGWWGSGGWHLRRITEEDMAARGDESWLLKNYVGTPVAVEPCPAYQAAAAKLHAEKQSQAAASAGRVGRLRA